MKIPDQYLPVMPYLIVSGANKFLDFTKAVFGATEQLIVPAGVNQIGHGEIKIHDAVIMFADASEAWNEKAAAMYLHVDNVDAIYKKAIDQGAKGLEAPSQKEYGYTAGFEDPLGNQWFIVQA